MKNHSAAGHLSAAFSIFVWGTTFISTKILLVDFAPIEILFYRFTLGFLALVLAYPRRLRLADRKQELYFMGAGLCGVTLYFLLENIALTYTLASNVGIIVSVAPFFTAIFAKLFLKGEPLRIPFFIGFLAAIGGICLISFSGNSELKLNPAGDLLALLAAIVWALYSVLTRKISAFGYPTIQTTRRTFFYGLLFMIPALFLMDFRWGWERFAQLQNLGNILYLGFGASAVCFVTWGVAVKNLGAVKTAAYIYLVPVITVITSGLILKEQITGMAMLGMALTLCGLFLSQSKLGRREKKTSEESGL